MTTLDNLPGHDQTAIVLHWYHRHHTLHVDGHSHAIDALLNAEANLEHGTGTTGTIEIHTPNSTPTTINGDTLIDLITDMQQRREARRAAKPAPKPTVAAITIQEPDSNIPADYRHYTDHAEAQEDYQRLTAILGTNRVHLEARR